MLPRTSEPAAFPARKGSAVKYARNRHDAFDNDQNGNIKQRIKLAKCCTDAARV
jgi:hypothetical protein